MEDKLNILGLQINCISFAESLAKVTGWAEAHTPSYVCFANVHMTIEACRSAKFSAQVNSATLVLPDGKPIASACRQLHGIRQERISGMDFTPQILSIANNKGLGIFVFGSTTDVFDHFTRYLNQQLPKVVLSGFIAPPFRAITDAELEHYVAQINESGANLVLVALGCPKQERWMAINSNRINAVLLGIGGALPVVAGLQQRAPRWMQRSSLEWLFRLMQEPKRMFRRYLATNTYFVLLLVKAKLKAMFK